MIFLVLRNTDLLLEAALELKWKPPTSEEREGAKESQERVLELAAQIKYSWDDEICLEEVSLEDLKRAEFLLKHKLESIKPEHLPTVGSLLGPCINIRPPPPRERRKKEIMEAIKKLRISKGPRPSLHRQPKETLQQ